MRPIHHSSKSVRLKMVRFEEKISVMPPPVCHDREAARVCPPFIRRIQKRFFHTSTSAKIVSPPPPAFRPSSISLVSFA